jgi:hypothetical protein
LAGVVLNSLPTASDDPSCDSNRDELERRCVPPVLAAVNPAGGFDRDVDWWALARG